MENKFDKKMASLSFFKHTHRGIELTMRYKLLGKSGLRVSELCLGTMTFGQAWGSMLAGASKEEFRKIFDLFL